MKKRILVLGVGSFAHSMMTILKDAGAEIGCYLTREYGHFGAISAGNTWSVEEYDSPLPCIREFQPDLILPMSIDWFTKSWSAKLIDLNIPIFCPLGEGRNLEIQRFFSEQLCKTHGIKTPISHYVGDEKEAKEIVRKNPRGYVIKNPVCSPFSPIHTIVCEKAEETLAWLERIDYSEGVYLQEYMGSAEAGHFAFVSRGKIQSIATNQEYKKAFDGNLGPVAGAPLGGIVEQDPTDSHELCRTLIAPLQPWFEEVQFSGPIQVTAVKRREVWYPIEYNVRLGVTSGAMFLRMMKNPVEVLLAVAQNQPYDIQWHENLTYGCSLTLAGYGYPYYIPASPKLPIILKEAIDCDLWWNEVESNGDQIFTDSHLELQKGHRLADIIGFGEHLETAIKIAYQNIKKIHCLSSYYRTDVGKTLWPPGVSA